MKILDKVQAFISKASYFDKDEIDLMIKLLEMYRDILKHAGEGKRSEKTWNTVIKLLDGFYILRNEKDKIERAKAGLQ